jgi:hypothetical protein
MFLAPIGVRPPFELRGRGLLEVESLLASRGKLVDRVAQAAFDCQRIYTSAYILYLALTHLRCLPKSPA